MKYRADILALYGDLFDEAHTSIEKYAFAHEIAGAGVGLREIARRIGSAGSRLFRRGGRAASSAAAPATAAETAAATQAAQATAAGAVRAGAAPAGHAALEDIILRSPQGQRNIEAMRQRLAAGVTAPTAPATAATAKPAKPGMGLGTLAAVGVPAAGIGGYMLGAPDKAKAEAERTRTRNVAFGAGAATGLAAPLVIRGLGNLANGLGGQGLYPGMMPGVGY